MKKCCLLILTITIALLHPSAWAKISIEYDVKGVSGPTLDNVKLSLTTAQATLGEKITLAEVKTFYAQSPEYIRNTLAANGYYKPSVRAALQQRGDKYTFTYYIDLGSAVRITSLQIHINGPGKDIPEMLKARHNIPIKVGDVLSIEKYNQTKTYLMHVILNQGYLDARWQTAQVLINRQTYRADINLVLETEQRYYFGRVTYAKTKIGVPLLKRLTPFKSGEPFSADKLLTLQDNLSSTNYFAHVTVEANAKRAHHRYVPVYVGLVMKNRQVYTIGLGYGTDTGIRGTLGVDLRYLNESGHRFESQINASKVKSHAYAQYIIPGKNPMTDQYTITASAFSNDTQSADGLAAQLAFAYVFSKNDWQHQYSLAALYSRNEDIINSSNGLLTTHSHVLYPNLNWRFLHTENQIDTPSGYRFNLRIFGAVEELLSSLSFAQTRLEGKAIFPVFNQDRVVVHGALGYNSTKDFKLPVVLRLFGGGSESLRGYSFESLPSIGVARYLYINSLEFQKRVYQQWYVGIFYDVGDVVVSFPSHIKQDAGLTIIRTTPIGTIEVGAAKSFGPGSQKVQFIVSVGPDL